LTFKQVVDDPSVIPKRTAVSGVARLDVKRPGAMERSLIFDETLRSRLPGPGYANERIRADAPQHMIARERQPLRGIEVQNIAGRMPWYVIGGEPGDHLTVRERMPDGYGLRQGAKSRACRKYTLDEIPRDAGLSHDLAKEAQVVIRLLVVGPILLDNMGMRVDFGAGRLDNARHQPGMVQVAVREQDNPDIRHP
jgi:hypothetical protein